MKIRKLEETLVDRAEGLCCGLPYSTELVSAEGCSIHFWCGDSFDEVLLKKALRTACNNRDIVRAIASLGQPTGFWARQDM